MAFTIIEFLRPIIGEFGGVGGFLGAMTGIMGVITGVIGLVQAHHSRMIAEKSNDLANTANRKSEEANELAKRANDISLKLSAITSDSTSYEWEVIPDIKELRFGMINDSLYDAENVEIKVEIDAPDDSFSNMDFVNINLYPAQQSAYFEFDSPRLEQFIRDQNELAYKTGQVRTIKFEYRLIIGWISEGGLHLDTRKEGMQEVSFDPKLK